MSNPACRSCPTLTWQYSPLVLLKYTWTFNLCKIFECTHLKFTVRDQSKRENKNTRSQVQCSPTSVGLAQACPNYGKALLTGIPVSGPGFSLAMTRVGGDLAT